MIIGSTKGFIRGKALSVEGHTHSQYAASSHTHTTSQVTGLDSEINSLKSSVSSGKAAIASAVTDKGVSTAADATFNTMATNIRNIPNIPEIYLPIPLYCVINPTNATVQRTRLFYGLTNSNVATYGFDEATCSAINILDETNLYLSTYQITNPPTAIPLQDRFLGRNAVACTYSIGTDVYGEGYVSPYLGYTYQDSTQIFPFKIYPNSSMTTQNLYSFGSSVDAGQSAFMVKVRVLSVSKQVDSTKGPSILVNYEYEGNTYRGYYGVYVLLYAKVTF